jgi:hypothetical protein
VASTTAPRRTDVAIADAPGWLLALTEQDEDQDHGVAPEARQPQAPYPAWLQGILDADRDKTTPGDKTSGEHDRHKLSQHLFYRAREHGYPDAEALWVAEHGHAPTMARIKQKGADWWRDEQARLIAEANAKHPHPGQTCEEITCANAPKTSKAQNSGGRRLQVTKASDIQPRPVYWLRQDQLQIPLGTLTLVGGREGIGKTIYTYTDAAAVTKGTLRGKYYGIPKAVVVAATEDSWEHTIVPRLMAAGADLERVLRVEVIENNGTYGTLVLPRDLIALEQLIKDEGAALLILDPLISRVSGDTFKSTEVRKSLEPLVEMLDRVKAAGLGIIHVSKRSDTDPLTLLTDSRAFAQVARAALFVMVDPDDENVRCIGTIKNNLGPNNLPVLTFSIEGATVAETEEGAITAGKLAWKGERPESIRELLEATRESSETRTAIREAMLWLNDYLTDVGGRAKSAEVKKAGKLTGHSESALNRARGRPRSSSTRRGSHERRTGACPRLQGRDLTDMTTVVALTDAIEMTGQREHNPCPICPVVLVYGLRERWRCDTSPSHPL